MAKRSLGAALGVTLAVVVQTSAGGASGATERDVAREIARTGGTYYDDGAWEKARDHFHRAYHLIAAPTLALMEARALVKLGRLVDALWIYELAASHVLDETNEAYRRASADARTELESLRSRVPKLTLAAPPEAHVDVRLNGVLLTERDLRGPLAVDPGTHVLELAKEGRANTWTTVALHEGEQRLVELSFPPDDAAVAALAAVERQRALMWSALVAGGAGLLVGLSGGMVAREEREAHGAMCGTVTCSSEEPGAGWQILSATGFALGVVGFTTGGLLLATLPRLPTTPPLRAFVAPAGQGLIVAGTF